MGLHFIWLKCYKIASRQGALVTGIDAGSPAAKAGLEPDDIITGVDGLSVSDVLTFHKRMLAKSVGDAVTLHVLEAGKERDVRLTVAHLPKVSSAEIVRRKLGLSVQAMTADLARSFGLNQPTGLLVTDVERGGPAEALGLARGDIILRFGPYAIETLDQLATLVEPLGREQISLVIVRNRAIYRGAITTR